MHGHHVHIDDEVLGKAYDTRQVLRLLGYLRGYWGLVCFAFVCLAGYTGAQLLGPYLVKIAVDRYIAAGDLAGLNRVLMNLQGVRAVLQVVGHALRGGG